MEELPGLYFMRARYYSAEAGVFLSTDSVKNIGPAWKPNVFSYANDNPLLNNDPTGKFIGVDDALFIAGVALYVATPYIEAFASGWLKGSIQNLAQDASIDLARGVGAPEQSVKIAEVGYGVKSFTSTMRQADKILAQKDPSGLAAAHFAGEQVSDYTTKPIENFSKFLMNSYMNGIIYAGDALGGVLYNQFGVGALPPLKLPTPVVNNSRANQTASVAVPKAAVTTAVTSTKPSGASGGGSASSGGGNTYTVKPGDTLGNIAYANHTTVSAIAQASGIQNVNLIHPGQVVTIRH